MICPKCQAEGPTGAVFCVGCGHSLKEEGLRLLRGLLGFTLLVTGFVMIMVALAPMLVSHPGDWTRLTAGCLMLPPGLWSLSRRRCPHADGEGRNYCPDCGLKTGSWSNPFRLSLLVLASLALAFLIFSVPVLLHQSLAELL